MGRYPILTAVGLGILVGVIGIAAMAVRDVGTEQEIDSPADALSLPTTTAVSKGNPGQSGIGSAGSGGQSCASRGGSRNGDSVQLDVCVSPTNVRVGQAVTFEGSAAPCDGVLAFGDGETARLEAGAGRTTLTHAYDRAGSYAVGLTAPGCGTSGEIALQVTVS